MHEIFKLTLRQLRQLSSKFVGIREIANVHGRDVYIFIEVIVRNNLGRGHCRSQYKILLRKMVKCDRTASMIHFLDDKINLLRFALIFFLRRNA